MGTNHLIAPFIQAFFLDFLVAQRGLSPNTIAAYRDCIKLFLNFAARRLEKPVDKLTVEDFQDKLVVAFLDDLETSRGNSTRTRNFRLAALHSLFRYIAGQQPEAMARCQQICTVPVKRTSHKTIAYLEDHEIRAVLDSVDPSFPNALRDYGLLLLLYNTGARAQEVVDLRIDKLRFEKPYQLKLSGKGRKERACPLWPDRNRSGSPELPRASAAFCNRVSLAVSQRQWKADHSFRHALHYPSIRGQSRRSVFLHQNEES